MQVYNSDRDFNGDTDLNGLEQVGDSLKAVIS